MTPTRHCTECGRAIPDDSPDRICPVCLLNIGLSDEAADEAADVPPPTHRDRNLLFGVFAVQLGLITKDAFMEAAAGWAVNPAVELPERLLELGVLSREKREFVDRLTDEAINHHRGDAKAALDSVDGETYSSQILEDCADKGTHHKLSTMLGLPAFISATEVDEIRAVDEGAGRYTTKGEQSRGGMGRILIVHDEFLDRDIALKELLPQRSSSTAKKPGSSGPIRASGALLARFLREAQVTGQLEHPSIVPVYELGRRPDGTVYYTMKLVRGQTFYDALSGANNLQERLALLSNFVDLCHAIAYAHSRGVVHRDLKPGNVMLGSFGETVVIDWGIAKVTGQKDDYADKLHDTIRILSEGKISAKDRIGRTSTGEIIGTPAYMAPEQVEGRVKDIDARTDVFALGVMLYEILTGANPFTGKTSAEIMSAVLTGTPMPITKIEPDVPPELVSVCEKAMQKGPEDRFQSAQELATEIERFQTGALVRTYQYSLGETLKHYYGKHRAMVNLAATTLLVLLVGGIYSYVSIRTAHDEAVAARDASRRDAYRAQIRLANSYMHENNYGAARDTLWATMPEMRHWEWSRLLDLAYQERYAISGYDAFAISNDESIAAAYRSNSDIRIFDPTDGSELNVIPIEQRELVSRLKISPDAAYIAGIVDYKSIQIWRSDTAEPVRTITVRTESLLFDSDGDRLVTGGKDGVVRIWNFETGEEIASFNAGTGRVDVIGVNDDGSRIVTEVKRVLTVWEPASGTALTELEGEATAVSDDVQLAAVARGGDVELSQVSNGAVIHSFAAHEASVNRIRFSAQGGRVLTVGSYDNSVAVWSVQTGNRLIALPHSAKVVNAVFSPDGAFVVTATFDGRLWVWDSATGVLLNELSGHAAPVSQIEVAQDGRTLLSAAFDQTIRAWPARVPPGQQIVATHPSGIERGIAFSETTNVVAVRTMHDVVGLFDLDTRQGGIEIAVAGWRPRLVADFSSDGDRIAVALDDFVPMVLDVETGEVQSKFMQHEGVVQALDFAPANDEVASGARDGTVRIWDASSGVERLLFQAHSDSVSVVRFSVSGEYVASGDGSGTVVVWRADSGTEAARFDTATDTIDDILWDGDGQRLFVASQDGDVHVWSPFLDQESVVYAGHRRPPTTVQLIHGRDRLLTGSSASMRVWDQTDGAELVALTGPSQNATDIRRTPESGRFLLRSETASVHLLDTYPWRNTGPAPAAEAEFLAYRGARPRSQAPYRVDSSETLVIVATTEMVTARLSRLLELTESGGTEGPTIDGEGLLIEAGNTRGAVARIGLHEDDRIQSVGGLAIQDRNGATAALEAALATVANGSRLELTITRSGFEKRVRYILLPHAVQSLTVQLTREEMIDSLQALSDGLKARGSSIASESRKMAIELGELEPGGAGLAGVWLKSSGLDEDWSRFKRSRASANDRILSVNELAIESLNELKLIVNETLVEIRSGDVSSYTVQVERGEFQTIRFDYEISTP